MDGDVNKSGGEHAEEEDEARCTGAQMGLAAKCSICSAPSTDHLHYGAVSCYSCRAFFRRGLPKKKICTNGHHCQITLKNRTKCKVCRYRVCLARGMVPEKVNKHLNKRKEREAMLARCFLDPDANESAKDEFTWQIYKNKTDKTNYLNDLEKTQPDVPQNKTTGFGWNLPQPPSLSPSTFSTFSSPLALPPSAATSKKLTNISDVIQNQINVVFDIPATMTDCDTSETYVNLVNMEPMMPFTCEEEFQLVDYTVRVEDFYTKKYHFMQKNLREDYKKFTMGHARCAGEGWKKPFSAKLDKQLLLLGLNFSKQVSCLAYDEIRMLRPDLRTVLLEGTFPTANPLALSIFEANSKEPSWEEQRKKIVFVPKAQYEPPQKDYPQPSRVPCLNLRSMARFTSPWAADHGDESKFYRVTAEVGSLLKDDTKLQALYHMLTMMTPTRNMPSHLKTDAYIVGVQRRLGELMYRYLVTCHPRNVADQKTRLLIGLIEELHDCADIMYHRSAPVVMSN